MNRRAKSFVTLLLSARIAVAAGLMGCSRARPAIAPTPSQTITLSAALISPIDVRVTWKDPASNAAGYVVEFATEPQGDFTTLGFLPPTQDSFTHPKLMPASTAYYRVRPFYGPASNAIDVALPETLSDAEYASRFDRSEDYSWAVPRTVPDHGSVSKRSVRDQKSAAEAAPTDLKASLVPSTVSGFQLSWSNHSSDEDGYLLEMKRAKEPDYSVRALLGRNINAFGYAFEPPERRATLRVRAFYFGQPSNLAHVTTGQSPSAFQTRSRR